MAWVDLETTGLDANEDVPLELGIILSDRFGHEVACAKWLIWEDNAEFLRGVRRGHENEFVQPMHEASGLWEDLLQRASCTRDQVDEFVCDFLQNWGVKYGTLPMAGNSIGSLDRPFTLVHFPKFNTALHYRNIDISSTKETVKLLNPDLFENLKPIIGTKADATHRVLDDCRASIREYQAYIREFYMIDPELADDYEFDFDDNQKGM